MERVKIKPRNPNLLFEVWLEEWKKEAASRNSDLQYLFAKALASLRKYPLPLKSGKDCIILQHFGTKLCSMLDRKLQDYNAKCETSGGKEFVCIKCNNIVDDCPRKKFKSQDNISGFTSESEKTELAVLDNLNLSVWNLENYAALLLLYKKTQDPHFTAVTETNLLDDMKALCGHASRSSVTSIFDHGLISMTGAPIRYNLTENGKFISKEICEITNTDVNMLNSCDVLNKVQKSIKLLFTPNSEKPNTCKNLNKETVSTQILNTCSEDMQSRDSSKSVRFYKSKSAGYINPEKSRQRYNKSPVKQGCRVNDMPVEKQEEKSKRAKITDNAAIDKLNVNATTSSENIQRDIHLEPGKFDIILLVDTKEISGGRTKPQHDATIVELSELGVLFEVRHLKVGDFAWIARCRRTNNELILPYIIERKRIDDLSASITDGRFHEQKFRLKQSGITNLMYIIEEHEKGQRLAIPHSSLMQASINTLVQDGFSIKYTKSHKDSMFYLSSLTRILIKHFKDKNLMGCKKEAIVRADISSDNHNLMMFEEFNKAASKQKVFQVKQMFVRQLLQLKGLSVEKALAIVENYPTPRLLVEAFQNCDSNGELLLANIQHGDKKRAIGPAISKAIYQLYTKKNLN